MLMRSSGRRHIYLKECLSLPKLGGKFMANAIQADFKRVQFTPELLPADLMET
jgi:hypothetical protein